MTHTIAYLPLDERPCNYDYPAFLAKMTDLTLLVPNRGMLGDKKRPGQLPEIAEWLTKAAGEADYVIVSVDMLLYGGIVPSRLHKEDAETLRSRLQVLSDIKRRYPRLKLYAFHLITRAPAYSSSEEEPEYYADYGRELYEHGWLRDKAEREGLTEEERSRWEEVGGRIPDAVLEDFLQRRHTNKRMNEAAVSLVEQGVIDYLVVPLDDNSKYGYTSTEQRSLVRRIREGRLLDRIAVYPGADEIGCTIFAKIFCEIKRYEPLFHVRYSSTVGPAIIPKYEDRSLNESVKYHIAASGGSLAAGYERPDIHLMVHSPAVGGYEAAETTDSFDELHHSYISEINLLEFAGAIARYAKSDAFVALADVALCNGGDDTLMQMLAQKGLLSALDGYAAWNTSGNAIGTVVSHAIVASYYRQGERSDAHAVESSNMYLYYRLAEDWGYQGLIRQRLVREVLPGLHASYFQIEHVQETINERIREELQAFVDRYVPSGGKLKVSKVATPWKRMFEIGFRLERE